MVFNTNKSVKTERNWEIKHIFTKNRRFCAGADSRQVAHALQILNSIPQDSEKHIYADLPHKHHGTSTVPIDITITPKNSDIIIVDRTLNRVTLFELSVPFEPIFKKNSHDKGRPLQGPSFRYRR